MIKLCRKSSLEFKIKKLSFQPFILTFKYCSVIKPLKRVYIKLVSWKRVHYIEFLKNIFFGAKRQLVER